MKRIGALSGMRGLMVVLVFQAGYNATVAAQEINPLDFVPLAVGNRWTYEHLYWNGSYTDEGPSYDIEVRKPFEIPGYPHGEGNVLPPRSLLFSMDNRLTIEITHTERIDGREYFVFSDAEYDWPPLPEFFWLGRRCAGRTRVFWFSVGTGRKSLSMTSADSSTIVHYIIVLHFRGNRSLPSTSNEGYGSMKPLRPQNCTTWSVLSGIGGRLIGGGGLAAGSATF